MQGSGVNVGFRVVAAHLRVGSQMGSLRLLFLFHGQALEDLCVVRKRGVSNVSSVDQGGKDTKLLGEQTYAKLGREMEVTRRVFNSQNLVSKYDVLQLCTGSKCDSQLRSASH